MGAPCLRSNYCYSMYVHVRAMAAHACAGSAHSRDKRSQVAFVAFSRPSLLNKQQSAFCTHPLGDQRFHEKRHMVSGLLFFLFVVFKCSTLLFGTRILCKVKSYLHSMFCWQNVLPRLSHQLGFPMSLTRLLLQTPIRRYLSPNNFAEFCVTATQKIWGAVKMFFLNIFD